MKKIILLLLILLASCSKVEYPPYYRTLTYSIEYSDGIVLRKYHFRGDDNAMAIIEFRNTYGYKWYDLKVAPYGKDFCLSVHSSTYEMHIISITKYAGE